jgi:hypothetical protein
MQHARFSLSRVLRVFSVWRTQSARSEARPGRLAVPSRLHIAIGGTRIRICSIIVFTPPPYACMRPSTMPRGRSACMLGPTWPWPQRCHCVTWHVCARDNRVCTWRCARGWPEVSPSASTSCNVHKMRLTFVVVVVRGNPAHHRCRRRHLLTTRSPYPHGVLPRVLTTAQNAWRLQRNVVQCGFR